MNRVFRLIPALLLLGAVSCLPARAQTEKTTAAPEPSHRFGIGAQAGTTGFGPVMVFTASKRFTATLGYTWLDYSHDVDSDDTEYDGKLKFSNIQAALNWHPFAGNFHLSAGAFLSNDKVDVTARPKANGTYSIGGSSYTTTEVGTLSGKADLIDGVAPFVGLGWSKTPDKSGLGFFFDLGVLFIDAPKAHLTTTGGTLTNQPAFEQNLRKEEADLNDDLDSLRYYPVVQLGIFYRF